MRAIQALATTLRAALPWRIAARAWLAWGGAAAIAFAVWLILTAVALRVERGLGNAAVVTGYALLVIMLLLAAFNLRKRLSVIPLGPVRAWMIAHVVLGALCVPLYFQHSGGLWPSGRYEQAIAFVFYVAMLSGIGGYFLEWLLPRRLTDLDSEIIYERIPSEIAALREHTEGLIVGAMQELGSDTLGRYYAESLDWFFWRPRFVLSHLVGSGRSARWIRGHIGALRRYLGESERQVLDQVEALALRKNQLDAHFALQGALKLWLFVHVPAAVLLVALVLWHLLLVNIYAL